MPLFTAPSGGRLREYNRCHNPAGAAGGRFCSDQPVGVDQRSGAYPVQHDEPQIQQISKSIYRVIDPRYQQPIRWKGPRGVRDIFTKREAERLVKVWKKRRAKDPGSFYQGALGNEEWEDLLGWMHGVVGG